MRLSLVLTTLILLPQWLWAFSLSDVSILLPLPPQAEMKELLSVHSTSAKGPLLPRAMYNKLPNLLPDTKPDIVYNELLHVVAIRLDPCFVEGSGPKACSRQIRLVWQPIIAFEDETFTRDAAVHTFHEFGETEWQEVLKAWKDFSSTESGEPLQVHPLLKQQGFTGPFWKKVSATILKFCGTENLIRATAMNVMNGEQVWAFAGIDISGASATPITIPRIGRTVQGIIMTLGNTDEFTGSIRPAASADPELEAFVQDSMSMRQNEKELKLLAKRIHEYENPKLSNPGTVDCVSCHVAQSARVWAQNNFQSWDWANDFKDQLYKSKFNITNKSEAPFKSNHFRAFGYFYDKAMISQRVVNESAEVVQTLSVQ